jgi:hypothetical protein
MVSHDSGYFLDKWLFFAAEVVLTGSGGTDAAWFHSGGYRRRISKWFEGDLHASWY